MLMKRGLGREGYTGVRTSHGGESRGANREAFPGEGASELGPKDLMGEGAELVPWVDEQEEAPSDGGSQPTRTCRM